MDILLASTVTLAVSCPSGMSSWIAVRIPVEESFVFLVAVWSRVSVGGVNLANIYPKFGQEDDPNKFTEVHKDVVDRSVFISF